MGEYNDEVMNLVGLGREEDQDVIDLRRKYANVMRELCNIREVVGRSEAGRNIAIAITELENSCMRAIKGFYSHKKESN